MAYNEGAKIISNSVYFEGSLNYNRTFKEKHNVSGMLVGIIRELKYANNGNLQTSLPYRNLGLSGRFTYAHDSKYFAEFNFGLNGLKDSEMKDLDSFLFWFWVVYFNEEFTRKTNIKIKTKSNLQFSRYDDWKC